MKIRLHMRVPRTPEAERIWLLKEVNSKRQTSRTFVKGLLWAIVLALAALVAYGTGFR
jgi:hypothetical protein